MSTETYGSDYAVMREAAGRQLAEYHRMRAGWETCRDLLKASQERETQARDELTKARAEVTAVRGELATVRDLLKTADADLAEERRRHPVCRCCGDPIPSAELLEVMDRAAPIGRMLTADATDLWAAGFCSSKCEQDFADAGPSEPDRCSQCHSGAPERAGLCRDCYAGKSEDEAQAKRDAERDYP